MSFPQLKRNKQKKNQQNVLIKSAEETNRWGGVVFLGGVFFVVVLVFCFFKQNIFHSNRGHNSKGLMSVHVGVC